MGKKKNQVPDKISHFWCYFNTVYYKTDRFDEFQKFNIPMMVFFKEEDSGKQKRYLKQVFDGLSSEEILRNIKIIKDYKDMYGNPLIGIEFNNYKFREYRDFCSILTDFGIKCYGQTFSKFNILINENLKIDNSEKVLWYLDIEIDNFSDDLTDEDKKVDIGNAVEIQNFKIISITLYDTKDKHYYAFVLDPKNTKYPSNKKIKLNDERTMYLFTDEKVLLYYFSKFIKHNEPEVICGWYSNDFDIPYILNRVRNLFSEEEIKEDGLFSLIDGVSFYTKRSYNQDRNWNVSIPGIDLIDYMAMFKKFSMKQLASWGLDFVQEHEGIQGKPEKKGFMNYFNDFDKYIDYIYRDVEILKLLEDKNNIMLMLLQLQQLQKMPLDRLYNMSMVVEQMIGHQTFHNKIVMDSNIVTDIGDTSYQGAIVLDPEDRTFNNCVVLDYESLYPNVIRTFNISPEKLLINEQVDRSRLTKTRFFDFTEIYGNQDSTIAKIGYLLDSPGIIPSAVDMLISERIRYKNLYKNQKDDDPNKQEYYLKQWNYKIILNSIYGFMGFKFSPIFNKVIAESITAGQRYMFNFQKDYFKDDEKMRIIYGDTDSVFMVHKEWDENPKMEEQEILEIQENLKNKMNDEIVNLIIPKFYNIDRNFIKNYLKLDVDKIFKRVRFFGTKKRYYGYGFDNKEIMHGIELVRSDQGKMSKDILTIFFRKQIDNELTEDDLKQEFTKIINAKLTSDFGESKSISKNNYMDYKVLPFHVRQLMFQKKVGVPIPEVITDKVVIFPVRIRKNQNPDLFQEQCEIFNLKSKRITQEKVNIAVPMDQVEMLQEIISKKEAFIDVDYQKIYDKYVLQKMEQFSNLMPIIERVRFWVNQNESKSDNLKLFDYDFTNVGT